MKTTVETVDATTVILTVEVPAADLAEAMAKAFKKIAAQISVPGFRKGKVPARIIEQRVGRAAVVDHAVDEALPELYRAAIDAEELRPIGRPAIDIDQMPVEEGQQLVFSANMEIRPEITLPSLDDFTVTVDATAVSDEEVEEELDGLRQRFGTLVGVDRPVTNGDFVVLDLVAAIDGEQIDTITGQSYEVGSGAMLDGLDEALLGLSADESTTFTSPLLGGEHAGADAEITVTVGAVKERELPAADDEFAQLASEFDTIAELRANLREGAEGRRPAIQAVQARTKLVEHLRDVIEFPVPKGVVEASVNEQLEQENRTDDDEHRAKVTEEITTMLRTQLILDTLAEAEEVTVEQPEVFEYLVHSARRYGMDPNEYIQIMAKRGELPGVVAELGRTKGITSLLRRVRVVEENGQEVDLSVVLGPEKEADSGEDFIDVTGAVTADEAGAGKQDSAK